MFLCLFLTALTCVAVLVFLKWMKVRSFWARRNVPHDSPHPILGSVTFLQKKNTGEWMREMYTKFKKTPYVGIWLLWKPALIINCPEIASRILVKDFAVFRDRNLGSGKSDPVGGLGIFTVNDPIWSAVRRKLTIIFTTAKFKGAQHMFLTKSNELCQRITNEREQNKTIDIRDVLTDYTTDLVGSLAFGVKCNATLTGDGPLRRVTRDFQHYNFLRGIAHTCIFFLPELVDIFRFSFYPKAAEKVFKNIFFKVVEQRGGFEKPVEVVRDLVDVLIKMKQDQKDDEEVTLDLLIAQAAILLQGGFETSSAALTFTLYELAHSPETQEKLYQELVSVKEKLEGKDFDTNALQQCVYLNCVLKETLRKSPPMGWLDRISSKEYKVDEHLTIPAGVPVYVNAAATQVDPDYFPEPEKFIPERFLPENEKDIKPFTYLPFGEGPRNCIGNRLAHQTVRFAVSALALKFEFRPLPGMPKPNDCILEKRSFFLLPGEFLSIEFIPRS